MQTKNLDAVYHEINANASRKEDFWRQVTADQDGCWVWTGGKYPSGYGAFNVLKRNYGAHTISYMLKVGPIPEGSQICHVCDNPPCVRPSHLVLGNAKVNMADKMQKRRHPVGERSYQSKLTDDLVAQIRASKLPGTVWAEKLGLSHRTVNKARKGDTWKHVGIFDSKNPNAVGQQSLSRRGLDPVHHGKKTNSKTR